ncbi:hypothetical protein A2U01_0118121, partial [Trifolium medium]|nr:hypothetical protein [Trifolium medium]
GWKRLVLESSSASSSKYGERSATLKVAETPYVPGNSTL